MIHILSRSFYALQNTITPMVINICTTVLIAIFTYIIAPIWGIQWFAIIWSIGFILQVIVLCIFLRKELTGFLFKEFFTSFAKTILATGLMAATIIFSQSFENILTIKLSYIVRILIGAGVFFLSAHMIKSPELSSIKYIVARLFKKSAKINND